MNTQDISRLTAALQQAFAWSRHVPEAEALSYKEKLVDIRRGLKKIQYALAEQCSAAAFGESQMGKSYLVSALLSTPDRPFRVTDGTAAYNFLNDINPSLPGSTIEATGVVTRFTTRLREGEVPPGSVRVRLLTVTDIVLILCEAYYNQTDYNTAHIPSSEALNLRLGNIHPSGGDEGHRLLGEDDVADIHEYLKTNGIIKKCGTLEASNYFNFLLTNVERLDDTQIKDVVKLLWNGNEHISRLFDDLLAAYEMLGFSETVYVEFDAVLRRYGTLLDVTRLNEMYRAPEVVGSDYRPTARVALPGGRPAIEMKKSFLSALTAELTFAVPAEQTAGRPFLEKLDLLDFPGARRPENTREDKLAEGNNLSIVLRRGKVSYLFNKYSAAKRINTLLFCHNNNQSAECTMGGLLGEWVTRNVGAGKTEREAFVRRAGLAPLFVVCTWFNKDLDYQDEKPGDPDSLSIRWKRRFGTVLETEVLKSAGDATHWFNRWTDSSPAFNNLYLLRDFKYSRAIFKGYDPEKGSAETELIRPEAFPDFMERLKDSFLTDRFVQAHFASPVTAWDEAASPRMDGTSAIIDSLNRLAPNVTAARDEKFGKDLAALRRELNLLLESYYHPDSGDDQIKQAKRQAGQACLQLDCCNGADPYFFGYFTDCMMLPEADVYEIAHRILFGFEDQKPMSSAEAGIFMSAGLSSEASRQDNIERLCDYLGVDTEEECRDALAERDVDIEVLLSQDKMQHGSTDTLVETIEHYWLETFLPAHCVEAVKDRLPCVTAILANLRAVYVLAGMRKRLTAHVKSYLNEFRRDVAVGLVADSLAMQLNAFTCSFGFDFIPEEERKNILAKNTELRLNLDEHLLCDEEPLEGVRLLESLARQRELLGADGFSNQSREVLMRFPQYRSFWRWEQQLKVGYLYACHLPDYDIAANNELKLIINALKPQP